MNKLNIKVKIPPEIQHILNTTGRNKTFKQNLIKIYSCLVYLKKTKPEWKLLKRGLSEYAYFDVPSRYLKNTLSHYKKYIDLLMENKIIDYYSKNRTIVQRNLFCEDIIIRHKNYDTENGKCMKYRFMVNIDRGIEKEIEFENPYKNEPWYLITKKSLKELGLEGLIKRDSYSRRLHTRITMNTGIEIEFENDKIQLFSYKDYLKTMFKGKYSVVDASYCQPTIMYQFLKSKNIIDPNFNYPFENNIDFYKYLEIMGLSSNRDEGKDKFVLWQNGRYRDSDKNFKNFFKISSNYINRLKRKNGYKKIGQIITREESKIFIDGLLSHIDLDFCLTVHDSLLVKTSDLDACLKYCNEKYGGIFKFKNETF